jgi:predicted Fe-S protein YdhL (DUF1289 family)
MATSTPNPTVGPMSPCINVCAIGLNGLCSGCLRTRDEIASWMRMNPLQQWGLMAELDRRRTRIATDVAVS